MRVGLFVLSMLAGVAFAVLLLGCTQDPAARIYRDVASQTFRVLDPASEASGGTGFAVRAKSGDLYIMTNQHVCEVADNNTVVLEQNGRSINALVLAQSRSTDLCLVSAPKNYRGLELAKRSFMRERVYIIGHPRLNPTSLSQGFINGHGTVLISYCNSTKNGMPQLAGTYQDFLMQIIPDCVKPVESDYTDAFSAPGNSGSAVVNADGDVVGVLFAGSRSGVSLLIPLKDVRDFLADY